jgi:hypothetical protein
MASIVSALDTHTPSQQGENNHAEYGWSNKIKERIVQLYFQLVRSNTDIETQLISIMDELLVHTLSQDINDARGWPSEFETRVHLTSLLYKLIGQTRDICEGKGEYALTYMLIYVWYQYHPQLAMAALRSCVILDNEDTATDTNSNIHPYGSWKDIKYFCNYVYDKCGDENHPLIKYACVITLNQLNIDNSYYYGDANASITLVAKWIPREKCKRFGWLFNKLALMQFPQYVETAKRANLSETSIKKAIKKAKMNFRKLISKLNKHLNTVQIDQCGRTYSNINFAKVTSLTMLKQRNAFQNVNKDGTIKHPEDLDRINCAAQFDKFIEAAKEGTVTVHGRNIDLLTFVRAAVDINARMNTCPYPDWEADDSNTAEYCSLRQERDLLNLQWNDNAKINADLENLIVMVDTSFSMTNDNFTPLYSAIGLGCRVAEKSTLGKRILTFSHDPTWVNLEHCNTFTDMVEVIQNGPIGYNTDFTKALTMILNACVEKRLTSEQVSKLCLLVASDMQIDGDVGVRNETIDKSMYAKIERKFKEAGERLWGYGNGYPVPPIIFWNLRATDGFPTMSDQLGATMVSGYSATLLNILCELGVEELRHTTPWTLFEKTMNSNRYEHLKNVFYELIYDLPEMVEGDTDSDLPGLEPADASMPMTDLAKAEALVWAHANCDCCHSRYCRSIPSNSWPNFEDGTSMVSWWRNNAIRADGCINTNADVERVIRTCEPLWTFYEMVSINERVREEWHQHQHRLLQQRQQHRAAAVVGRVENVGAEGESGGGTAGRRSMSSAPVADTFVPVADIPDATATNSYDPWSTPLFNTWDVNMPTNVAANGWDYITPGSNEDYWASSAGQPGSGGWS